MTAGALLNDDRIPQLLQRVDRLAKRQRRSRIDVLIETVSAGLRDAERFQDVVDSLSDLPTEDNDHDRSAG